MHPLSIKIKANKQQDEIIKTWLEEKCRQWHHGDKEIEKMMRDIFDLSKKVCKCGDSYWTTSCGGTWIHRYSSISASKNFKFCPSCGDELNDGKGE